MSQHLKDQIVDAIMWGLFLGAVSVMLGAAISPQYARGADMPVPKLQDRHPFMVRYGEWQTTTITITTPSPGSLYPAGRPRENGKSKSERPTR